MSAVIHGPGEGEKHDMGGASVTIKAGGDQTSGKFFLAESTIDPGFAGPPPHLHHQLHDMFYVLDGVLTVRIGDETIEAGPGTFICVPPGALHTFSNPSSAATRFLNFNAPSGWEEYMRALARELPGDRPPTPEEIGNIASRYDFHAV